MPSPIDPGPLFKMEVVATARRWQTYALRAALIAALFSALFFVYINDWESARGQRLALKNYAALGHKFAVTVLMTQLAIITLAAPAATAGAICLDKTRGNLTLLMASTLNSAEIVLGKLGARMLPVFGLIIASIPVLFIASLLGGISGEFVTGGFIVIVGVAVFAASVAFLFSVWVGRTHEALLLTYFVIFACLLLYPIFDGMFGWRGPAVRWLFMLNPATLMVGPLFPAWGVNADDYLWFLVVTLSGALIFVSIAIWRLRHVVLTEANRGAKSSRPFSSSRALRSDPLLSRNPMRWYERHRRRPTKAGRIVNILFVVSALFGTAWVLIHRMGNRGFDQLAPFVAMFQIGVGLLLATVFAVTALADERVRGSLDILLTTPVTTRSIVSAKWWSAYRRIPWLVVLPLMTGIMLAFAGPVRFRGSASTHPELVLFQVALLVVMPLATGAFCCSLGLYLATRLKQFGRAVGVAVAILVAVSIGWPILVMATSAKNDAAVALIVGSPAFGPGFLIAMLMFEDPSLQPTVVISASIWSAIYSIVAFLLYEVTVRIFDFQMGRISDRTVRPVRPRPRPQRGLGVEWVEPRGMP